MVFEPRVNGEATLDAGTISNRAAPRRAARANIKNCVCNSRDRGFNFARSAPRRRGWRGGLKSGAGSGWRVSRRLRGWRRGAAQVDDVVGLITVSRRPQGSGGVTASDSVRINRPLQITKTK